MGAAVPCACAVKPYSSFTANFPNLAIYVSFEFSAPVRPLYIHPIPKKRKFKTLMAQQMRLFPLSGEARTRLPWFNVFRIGYRFLGIGYRFLKGAEKI